MPIFAVITRNEAIFKNRQITHSNEILKNLGSFIEDWKENMEQTDDILVIGVRI
jgi:hypothetical protein